jgi:glycosyltransferase involved in cell wall biosynthesis
MNHVMKIGFINFTPMKYDVETPLIEPLGGSESSMCYLAAALARHGQEVTLFARDSEDFVKFGVRHLPHNKVVETPLDVLVIQNTPAAGVKIRKIIGDKTKIVFWSQHASNQPPVESLKDKEVKDAFDKIVLISNWQKENYLKIFGINKSKICILRNAISPAFENLKGKKKPLSMAYTSTPFRGLGLLLEIFSGVKAIKPSAHLAVFSSLKVYQSWGNNDANYEKLYEACRQTFGVEYVGSLSQQELAKRLAKIEILSYPNIFPETSCIAVMEAMAAGCQIVTSELGALKETAAGFGRLIPFIGRTKEEYVDDFTKALSAPIDKANIKKQVEFVNKNYVWKVRAKEWEKMLTKLLKD